MRLWAAAALVACSRSAPPSDAPPPKPLATVAMDVPALPKTAAEADDMVAKARRRKGDTAGRSSFALDRASHDLGHAYAGFDDIAGALGGGGYLLFGATHDSAAQVDAFRSIVTRIDGLGAVALEQLSTADDADLDAFFRSGDADARQRLRERQRTHDYAAWKFGYTAKIEDLLLATRGVGIPVLGCDMPIEVRDSLPRDLSDDAVSALRERHCAFAVESRGKTSVALLVGANHAEGDGLTTFLSPDARVRSVFFVGGRDAAFADPEDETGSLEVALPVMLQLDEVTSALLLPESTAIGVSRFRDRHAASGAPSGPIPLTLLVTSDFPVTFEAAGIRTLVGQTGEWLSLRNTTHVFAFRTKSRVILGGLRIPIGGWTALHLGTDSLDISEHEP